MRLTAYIVAALCCTIACEDPHLSPVVCTAEVCDGLDNNCNGDIDETCDCAQGQTRTCGSNVGACRVGTSTCTAGFWSDCTPAVVTTTETCNGVDDDCNGQVDDGLDNLGVCNDLPSPCVVGVLQCLEATLSCDGAVFPELELCNGIDDDCDGSIDNEVTDVGEVCGPPRFGICRSGRTFCSGTEIICVDAVYPMTEACNRLDDDCNGWIDDQLFRPCSTLCEDGIETCQSGQWIDCNARQPSAEVCGDQIDNDCDGTIDDGCLCNPGDVAPCIGNVIGPDGLPTQCGVGLTICGQSGEWGVCRFWDVDAETCNNWDDDCDGVVDAYTQPCGNLATNGLGVCRLGTEICTGGEWDECVDAVDPSEEICDQLDNDCNGFVDDDLNASNKVDLVFLVDASGSMCGYTAELALAMQQYIADFVGTDHQFAMGHFPAAVDFTSTNNDEVLAYDTTPILGSVADFVTALASLTCDSGGLEPSRDALVIASFDDATRVPFMHTSPSVGWRPDAEHYIVVITDEEAQSGNGLTEFRTGALTGDKDVWVVTKQHLFSGWDGFVQSDRLFEIDPPVADYYVEVFRQILRNLCR